MAPAEQRKCIIGDAASVFCFAWRHFNPGQNESTSGKVLDDQPSDTRMEFARTAAGNMSGYELLVRNTGGSAFFGMPPRLALADLAIDAVRDTTSPHP